MKYKDYISVNENFQYSVNLQFDINNIAKIKEYIPTKDGCELLKQYFASVLNSKNRATTLVGPYGKGKSHLLLVLITLLNNYNEEDKKAIDSFLNKIKKVDQVTYDLIMQIRSNHIKMMPIIINSNYGDLNQAFLLALSEALEREKLSSIVVNTYFDIALKVILKWEDEYKDVIGEIKKCLTEYNCSFKDLKQGLKKYSEEYYNIFKNVYSCILHGQEFNPLVNSDIVKIYKDMVHEIEEYGYSGMFIVFDEFSKFLEYVENSHMMKDLKLLQDFAELANRTSEKEQIHLSCITHKTINQYAKNLSEDKLNAFKTVEGRFKELYFNRSIEQNYEIVSYALNKKEGYNECFDNFYNKNIKTYDEIKKLSIFKNVDNIENNLFKGCYPLNPLTVYCLVQLSEKIAQNERTLFTFLTDDDQNGLKFFIDNNDNGLFNVNKIYDYFKPLFKKETNELIRNIWLKSENALNKCTENDEKSIIKALAIIYMINETETLIPDDNNVRLAANITLSKYDDTINKLIEKSIIKRRKITNELDFTNIYNRELSKEIKKLSENQFYNINIKDILNEIETKKYSLPRRYNEEYKITRFFDNIHMTEDELLSIKNLNILFDNNYCDGIIIDLIRDSRNVQDIIDHFNNLSNDRVVLRIPKTIFPKSIVSLLREYKSIEYLINSKDNDESNNELLLIKKETIDVLEEQISLYFASDNIQEYIYMGKKTKNVNNISSYLSDICFDIYSKTPIVNNEMINKRDLSAPIKKARDIVIDTVLNNDLSLIKSKTSAEATIYKAIVDKKNNFSIKNIINIINEFVEKSENQKISFSQLYDKLESKPYSVRKGIIPILLSIALYNYSDIIIIYFMNKEIELDSSNLIKINDNPEKYFILTEKGTTDKIKYLSNLMYIYNIPNLDNQRINLRKLVDGMRRWILSLPRILREYSNEYNYLDISKEFIIIKNELLRPDINNNEFIYQRLNEIFDTANYEKIVEQIKDMKQIFDNFITTYCDFVISKTKELFSKNYKGSLNSLLKDWLVDNKLDSSNRIYDIKTRELIEYVKDLTTHDERDIIEKISKIVTGFYIEDWQPNEMINFSSELEQIINNIANTDSTSNNYSNKITLINGNEKIEKVLSSDEELSALGNTMKNNLEEIINEYGDSLTEQEKISVLIDIMKKYM